MQQWTDERIRKSLIALYGNGGIQEQTVIPVMATMRDEYERVIADLAGALANAQEVASEQSRLRALTEGKLAEATLLIERADTSIVELDSWLSAALARIIERERQLAATLTTIEAAASDGRLYAEGCKP